MAIYRKRVVRFNPVVILTGKNNKKVRFKNVEQIEQNKVRNKKMMHFSTCIFFISTHLTKLKINIELKQREILHQSDLRNNSQSKKERRK